MLDGLKNIYNFYVERYKKRFLYCLGFYFLLVVTGGIIGVINPNLSSETMKIVGSQFSTSFPGLMQAINVGQLISVVLTIFGINSVFGSFLSITVPNMVGIGTLTFIFRPILWGLIYAPISQPAATLLLIIIPTLILEGTAYVIAFTSSIDLLLAILKPAKLEETSRLKAMKKAWIYNLKSYVLVLIVLFVAAVVETATIGLIR